MRAHYTTWVKQVRPDLLTLHQERFKSGAYQPQAERDRLSELVRATARRFGVTGRAPYERSAPVQITPTAQLSLL
jgi:hypothetical protein